LLVSFGRRTKGWRKAAAYVAALASVALVPAALRTQGIVFAPDTALIFIGIYGTIRLWQKRARRIQLTSASGLPNLLALGSKAIPVGSDVVVAVVARYEEILATLPRELHGECAKQIARRIAAGSGADTIYHGDGGHFAWAEEARPLEMQLDHLEGLRALFSAPLLIGSHTFDTNIHFGLDRNEGLDSPTRVNSALASANEALSNGRAIELFEASRLAEAPWELSLHARIEEGLRNGDIWLAFQPQWNLKENRMCGAEALIRWNHPTRGPIAPDAFILQAERAGRIDALTYWVLDLAITAALALNARGPRFHMSINLSAQMVDKPDLVANFSDAVRRRNIDPSLLTIEITETSSVRNRPAACQNLTRLRELGFRLSIDDFGTGEASLAYLADLPSDELKIDRRFIDRLGTSPRDQAIVANTITLAHSLGQTVVAEGIERPETLAILQGMGCDYAQGYLLGRPVTYSDLEKTYAASLSRAAGQV
jgi:EAL domain-containing protein (putative c-di-GMP-specific phosphodiesterase class I)